MYSRAPPLVMGGPLPSASVHRGALFSGVALFRVFARELMSNDCEKENKRKWLIYGFVFLVHLMNLLSKDSVF
jgi:hypothetical protein